MNNKRKISAVIIIAVFELIYFIIYPYGSNIMNSLYFINFDLFSELFVSIILSVLFFTIVWFNKTYVINKHNSTIKDFIYDNRFVFLILLGVKCAVKIVSEFLDSILTKIFNTPLPVEMAFSLVFLMIAYWLIGRKQGLGLSLKGKNLIIAIVGIVVATYIYYVILQLSHNDISYSISGDYTQLFDILSDKDTMLKLSFSKTLIFIVYQAVLTLLLPENSKVLELE